MPDEVFEYKLKVTAEGGGGAATAADIEKANEAAQKASKGLQKTTEAATEAKEELKDGLNPALESFSEKADKGTEKSHDLRSAVKGLKMEFPELAHIARFAMSPIAGAVAATTFAIKLLQFAFDSIFQRINTGIGGGNFRSGMEALQKAALDSAVAFEQYERALAGAATAETSVQESSQKATTALRAHGIAVAEAQNAQKALELARINFQEAQGKLNGPQAIKARIGVEDKYARQKVAQDLEARDKEVGIKRKELEDLRLEAYNAEQDVGPLKKKADEAATALSRNDTLLTESKKTKTEVDKQVAALQTAPFLGPGMLNQLRAAQGLSEQVGPRIRVLEANKPELADQAKSTAESYEAAKSRALSSRAAATKLGQDMPGIESDAAQLSGNESEIARRERLTRNYGAATEITGVANQGKEKEAHIKAQIMSAVHSGGPVTEEVLKAFKAQEAQNEAVVKELAEQTQRIKGLEGRVTQPY
jgi:hypothetical protein